MKTTMLKKSLAVAFALLALATPAVADTIYVTQPTATKGTKSGRVDASWPWSSYANYGYNVYRTPTAEYRNPVKLGKTSNQYWVDRTAQAGRKYWYWIGPIYNKWTTTQYYYRGNYIYYRTIYHYKWYAPISGDVAADAQGGFKALTIPQPIVSKGKSSSALYIRWNKSPQARYGYRIYRSRSPKFTTAYSVGTTYNTSFLDYSAQRGVDYYYWVCPRCFNFTPYSPGKWDWGYLY